MSRVDTALFQFATKDLRGFSSEQFSANWETFELVLVEPEHCFVERNQQIDRVLIDRGSLHVCAVVWIGLIYGFH